MGLGHVDEGADAGAALSWKGVCGCKKSKSVENELSFE